ncbi:MAG: hypothetical protein FJ098_06360 [Deltaproteobacteria bacterium]|nr:hypothetical protein [Deltaproteobacteria bacterium]
MRTHGAWNAGWVLAVLCVAPSCDSGNGSGGETDAAVAKDSSDSAGAPDTAGGGLPDTAGGGLPDLTGRVYLFSRLETYVPTDMFNSTWAKDLSNDDIVIMLRVHEHDRATDTLSMSVVTGAAERDPVTGEVLAWHPSLAGTPLEVALADGAFTVDGTFTLDIMTENLSRPLHLVDLTGEGEILEDGGGVRNGVFVGGLLEGDMKTLCMGIAGLGSVNLHWFLTTGGICPDRDTDGDGTADAYTFDWHFDAVDITDRYDDGILEVVSWVTDCVSHEGACVPK